MSIRLIYIYIIMRLLMYGFFLSGVISFN